MEHGDIIGAAPIGDAPTTSEWSTILLHTKVQIILEDDNLRIAASYFRGKVNWLATAGISMGFCGASHSQSRHINGSKHFVYDNICKPSPVLGTTLAYSMSHTICLVWLCIPTVHSLFCIVIYVFYSEVGCYFKHKLDFRLKLEYLDIVCEKLGRSLSWGSISTPSQECFTGTGAVEWVSAMTV